MSISAIAQAQLVTSGNTQIDNNGAIRQSSVLSSTRDGWYKGDLKDGGSVFYAKMMDQEGLDSNSWFGFDILKGVYLQDNLFVQGGLGFMVGGVGISYDAWNSYSTTENFLSVPMAIGYDIPLGEKSYFEIYTGPRLNYLIAGKMEYKSDGETEKIRYKDLDNVKRFNLNWAVGATIMFGKFGITAEYRPALNDDFADFFHIGIVL